MNIFEKIETRVTKLALTIAISATVALTAPAQNIGQAPSAYSVGGTTIAQWVSNNVTMYTTNALAGLTNVLSDSASANVVVTNTTAQLFSVLVVQTGTNLWTGATNTSIVTNAFWGGGTNALQFNMSSGRFATVEIQGTVGTNNNQAVTPAGGFGFQFAGTAYSVPTVSSNYETAPSKAWYIGVPQPLGGAPGYFSFVTNIEDDALSGFQLAAAYNYTTNSYLTNFTVTIRNAAY